MIQKGKWTLKKKNNCSVWSKITALNEFHLMKAFGTASKKS